MSYQFARLNAFNKTATAPLAQTRARGFGEPADVVRRRAMEDQRAIMDNEVAKDFASNQHAVWEKKTAKTMEANAVHRLSRKIKEGEDAQLLARRARLAAKLSDEDSFYRDELARSVEPPHERARRLIETARKFKAQREQKREQFAAAARERQWKDSCDDLRTIDSQFFNHYCGQQVRAQMGERVERRARLDEEEKQWAAVLEEDRLQKVKKEEARQAQRVRETIENRLALRQQIEELSIAQKAAQAEDEREKEIFQQILAMDAKAAKEKAIEDLERKKEINRQNAAYNERLQRERRERFAREREAERVDLEKKLEAYREDTIRHENNVAQQKADMAEFRNYLARRREEERRMEKEMERLIQEDLDRANAQRDLVWEKERLGRERLMKEVYETRAQQVYEKGQSREAESRERERLKAEAEEEARRAAYEENLEEEQERQRVLTRKMELEQQIRVNENRLALQRQAKIAEKEAAEEAEREYQERLTKFKQSTIEQSARNYGIKNALAQKRPY